MCPSPSTSAFEDSVTPGSALRGSGFLSTTTPTGYTVTMVGDWPEYNQEPDAYEDQAEGSNPRVMIEEVSFRNIRTHDVCIAAYIVHTNSPLYDGFKHQSYWLSDLVVRVLASCDPGSRQVSIDRAVKARVLENQPRYEPDFDGECHPLSIYRATSADAVVEGLRLKYLENKLELTQAVGESVMEVKETILAKELKSIYAKANVADEALKETDRRNEVNCESLRKIQEGLGKINKVLEIAAKAKQRADTTEQENQQLRLQIIRLTSRHRSML